MGDHNVSVIDNVLGQTVFDKLKSQLLKLPVWAYGETLNNKKEEPDYGGQMECMIYLNMYDGGKIHCLDENYEFISKIIQALDIKRLIRIKANLLLRTESNISTGWHTDIEQNNLDILDFAGLDTSKIKTAVIFMNTCDGYVDVGDDKYLSVENRCVSFPVLTKHTGATATDSDYRMVINVVYEEV